MCPELDRHEAERLPTIRANRRSLLAGAAGAVVTGAGVVGIGRAVLAQDATPEAEPQQQAAASPAANVIGSDRFPVRTELGPAVPPEYTDAETNWPSENANLASTRQALGSAISAETVGQLGLAWSFPVEISATYGALVANPVIVGNVVYQQDALSNVYARNRETGEEVWTIEHNEAVPSGGPNGVAAGYGYVVYTLGGPADVIAVKADSGEEAWRTNVRGLRNEGITMAPIIHDSTVYVSTIPGTVERFYQGNQRGHIIALDLIDGQVLWYFDTTVDNLWGSDGGNARVNSGGGLWHPPSFDDEGNVYVGIGNASPFPGIPEYPAGSSRPGDNDYANATIRIDPDRAAIDWYVNVKPHDLFDLDNQLSPILTTVTIDGAEKRVAISSGKHGYVVAFDQETGEEYWRTPVGEHKNDDLQELTDEYVEVSPGVFGGTETPMAYAEGIVFAPVFRMPSFYNAVGLDLSRHDFSTSTGHLVALDAATGEIIWQVDLPTGVLAGATVANDVVFTGGLDGIVRGFKTDDGSQVFSYQTASGLNAPLAISGDYLYVPSGGPLIPSVDTWDPAPEPAAALIALKIGGEIQTGPPATPAGEASPAASPAATGEETVVTAVDLAFEPREFTIPANTDVAVLFRNDGALQHDFVIDELGIKSDLLDGGAETTLTINAEPGTYTYYCSVTGHRQAGMEGTLTVE